MPFRITADPVGLKPADLPIASRPQPPQARGSARHRRAARPGAHAAFAPAGLLTELDLLDQLPASWKPDLTDLGPNGTVTSTSLDLATCAPSRRPGRLGTKLGASTPSPASRQGGARRLKIDTATVPTR